MLSPRPRAIVSVRCARLANSRPRMPMRRVPCGRPAVLEPAWRGPVRHRWIASVPRASLALLTRSLMLPKARTYAFLSPHSAVPATLRAVRQPHLLIVCAPHAWLGSSRLSRAVQCARSGPPALPASVKPKRDLQMLIVSVLRVNKARTSRAMMPVISARQALIAQHSSTKASLQRFHQIVFARLSATAPLSNTRACRRHPARTVAAAR